MPLWIRLLIAGALSIDLIAVSKAIITGLAISPAGTVKLRRSGQNPRARPIVMPRWSRCAIDGDPR
jgi:hypothetical protein